MHEETNEEPKRYRCRHIFTDGRRCGSPCLRGEAFCYYHHTTRRPIENPRQRRARQSHFALPLPEDRSAIQSSIGQVLQRIAANEIDPKRAGLLLYGLQIASLNLPREAAPSRKSSREAEADSGRRGRRRPHLRPPRSRRRTRRNQTQERHPVLLENLRDAPAKHPKGGVKPKYQPKPENSCEVTEPGAPCPASGTWEEAPLISSAATEPPKLQSDSRSAPQVQACAEKVGGIEKVKDAERASSCLRARVHPCRNHSIRKAPQPLRYALFATRRLPQPQQAWTIRNLHLKMEKESPFATMLKRFSEPKGWR